MLAKSFSRSACTPALPASSAPHSSALKMYLRFMRGIGSERHHAEEEAAQLGRHLHRVDAGIAAIFEAGVGDLGRRDLVAIQDRIRVHGAREADVFGALVERH